jgi:maltose alpha-D-glucosyltransferase/alpha-amylase
VDDIIAAERVLLDRLNAVRRDPMSGKRIRVHGDFRLDEVRLVDDHFAVVDLSGDHSLPMSERRLRASPLRDVAEMLRSIDYVAGHTALPEGEARRLWAQWWGRAVGFRFFESYSKTMEDSLLLPDQPAAIDALIESYWIVRALQELHWEMAIRPDWVEIPATGLRRVLGEASRIS